MPTFSCGVEEIRTSCSSGVVIFNPFLRGGEGGGGAGEGEVFESSEISY